jgi:prevent-host-death family protein
MEKITTRQLRLGLSDIISRVAFGGERVVVSRNGKDTAAVISLDDLEILQAIENKFDVEAFLGAKDEETIAWDDLKDELDI